MGGTSEKLVFGVDPSPSGTAIVALRKGVRSVAEPDFVDFWFCTETKKTKKSFSARALWLSKVKRGDEAARLGRMWNVFVWFLRLLRQHKPDYVAMEDYVWNPMMKGKEGKKSVSQSTIQVSEIGGALRLAAMQARCPLRTYEPSTVKLTWTGKGNAKKEEMTAKAVEYLRGRDRGQTKDLPRKEMEDVADALAVGWLFCQELMVRAGTIMVRDLPPHLVRVFNRVTKATPDCLLDRSYVVSP